MEPLNYNITPTNTGQSFGSGFNLGATIAGIKQQTEAQKTALNRRAQMQIDVHKTFTNPNATPDEIAYIAATYPEISEQVTKAWNLKDTANKDASLKSYIPAYSAVLSGKPEIAAGLLNERATALEGSGRTQEAAQLRQQADIVTKDPSQAKNIFGLQLSAIMGPEKFADTFKSTTETQKSLEQAPAELDKKVAEAKVAQLDAANKPTEIANKNLTDSATATIKTEEAKNAPAMGRLSIDKITQDIAASKANTDIARQNARIAAMNAAYNREGNELKRTELKMKLDDAQKAREQKVRDVADAYEGALSATDGALDTINNILGYETTVNGKKTKVPEHPGLSKAVGPIASKFPTLGDDAADFEALNETLQSKAFLNQISNFKGMGALSDAEGKKLNAALSNLTLKQSPESYRAGVKVIKDTLEQARKRAIKKYGADSTGQRQQSGATIDFGDLN